nr:cytochrome P450 83B1 like protein [Lolium multiflorum]
MAVPALPNPWPWPLITLIPSIFIFPLLYLFFRSGRQRARNAPGPPKQLPVLGNLLQLGSRPHRYFQAVARKYGPVVQVQLGRVRMVVVASPEAAKEVLRTNDLHCCSRPNSPGARMLSYNFLDVAFGPYSDYWREMRKLLVVELLSTRRVQSFAYARAAEVDLLVDSLTAAPPATPVNLSEKLYALSDGIIGTVAFGKMYGSASFERSSFQQMMDETLRVLGSFTFEDFFPSSALARWADVLTGAAPRRRRVFRKIDAFFDAVIDRHLEPERLVAGVQEDMVDALVKMWRDGQEGPLALTRENIKGILMDTFTGGIDTCAVTTIWIMSELMRNPRVMQKAQSEVRAAVTNKPRVGEEDVHHLKYLKMILKENFRLHPPGTLLIPRETMQSCKVAGYSVPAGTRIHVNVWAMGRDPDIWDRPEDFYPERFQDADVDFRGSHFELLPFGSGRRACPAIAMGVANVELVLANLLYCFDWELPEGMKEQDIDMEETGQLVFRKKVPLLVVPVKH